LDVPAGFGSEWC